jgi:serine protease Do
MKKRVYPIFAFCFLFLTGSQIGMAQHATSPAPPPPPASGSEAVVKSDQKEIIIRQKGDKDSKIVLEIKNGEYFINGKPLEKFDDQNIVVEKRDLDEDGELSLSFSPSPFRVNPYNEERMQETERDLRGQEFQNDVQKAIKVKMNMAFLGVSSHRTEKGGATVLEVTAGSPAEKAGIKKGDIIQKVNDTKVDNPDELFEAVHNYKPGDKVNILFVRDGKEQTVTATLDKSNFAPKSYNFDYKYNYKMPEMDLAFPPMGDMQMGRWNFGKPRLGIKAQDDEDGKGVTVLEVNDSSAAAKAGLKKGDIIQQVDGVVVNSINDLMEQTMSVDRNKYTYKLKISRNGVIQEIEIKIPRKLKTAEL